MAAIDDPADVELVYKKAVQADAHSAEVLRELETFFSAYDQWGRGDAIKVKWGGAKQDQRVEARKWRSGADVKNVAGKHGRGRGWEGGGEAQGLVLGMKERGLGWGGGRRVGYRASRGQEVVHAGRHTGKPESARNRQGGHVAGRGAGEGSMSGDTYRTLA